MDRLKQVAFSLASSAMLKRKFSIITFGFNQFEFNVIFLYPLKTLENQWFYDPFRGFRDVTLDSNGLIALAIKNDLKKKRTNFQKLTGTN